MYSIRNSDLFAILAGIGNRTIGPGGDKYDRFTVISRPRGLPPDVSQEVRKEYEKLQTGYDGWDDDTFYASWLTIREILDFDWNQATKEIRKDGAAHLTPVELNRTYPECVSPFLEFCEYLDFQFSTGSNAERGSNVRLVFWFDF